MSLNSYELIVHVILGALSHKYYYLLSSLLLPHISQLCVLRFGKPVLKLPSDAPQTKEYEWDSHYDFPRDIVRYGENSFNQQWPGGAKITVSFVINFEEVHGPGRLFSVY